MKYFFAFLFFFFTTTSFAQYTYDVQHYRFELEVTDASDAINGKAYITVKFLQNASQVVFDLISLEEEKGMYAFEVKEAGENFRTTHTADVVTVYLSKPALTGEVHTYEIGYMGTPKDGLIISKNKYGDRTFFADNWPNRARNWIPCHDDPADKATVEFVLTAPAAYKVIANGKLVSEKVSGVKKITDWKEEVQIPTKVMVVGIARFAVQPEGQASGVPVSAWVYPQDSAKGVFDYALAVPILNFYSGYIAPFPFEKLANVQSKTIFGGMENASAIFYAEQSVTGDRKSEPLLAHEIAHQWFGDAATEKSFAHLWLSEGFATYFTNLYIEQKYGRDSMSKRLEVDRQQVIRFMQTSKNPVVDTASDLMDLLNANSYQKGGWVLHMLRNEVGDSTFHQIIKAYYNQYKGGNADTRDFEKVAETVSGKDLKLFFDQWLYTAGIPQLTAEWKATANEIKITVQQAGKILYQFPLTIGYRTTDGKLLYQTVSVSQQNQTFTLPVTQKPASVFLDPFTNLLFSGSITEAK